MPIKRTTHRSSKGTKLYAVRDSKGRFKDIQTYKRAQAADMRRKSKAESAAKLKKGKKTKRGK
jgi:DNA-binding protein HU-beta